MFLQNCLKVNPVDIRLYLKNSENVIYDNYACVVLTLQQGY